MKQKIVISVPMHTEKCRSKAFKIAVAMKGVSAVSLGKEKDRLEVTGEGVDSVCLANCLRKKFCFADIISVEEVKPPKPPETKPPEKPPICCPPPPCPPPYYGCAVYDSGPPNCCLM